jgi:hypothetical protein
VFASGWAPADDSAWAVRVPGARVDGPKTAANLLNIAVWSLREQGLIEIEQVRPVVHERFVVMGGRSFVRVSAVAGPPRLPGLEGVFLRQAREPGGLRDVIYGLGLSSGSPWTSVVNVCSDEARDAGIVEMRGRLFRKPVIAAAVELDALRERDGQIAAARSAHRERERDLDDAVIADCLAALHWTHNSGD